MRKIKTGDFDLSGQSKQLRHANSRGFTLMEVLVYIGVFSVASVFLTNILLTVTDISTRESASREVSFQLDTTLQTIQQLIQQSSNIESASGSTLKLRMADPLKDPTCITLESEAIKIAQGSNGADLDACSTTKTALTTNKVKADSLNFTKIDNIQYSAEEGKDLVGHSVVNIDMGLSYNTTNSKYKTPRTLTSAIGRVSAATFDSDLLPDSTNSRSIGNSGLKWQSLSVNGAAYFGINAGSNIGIGTISPAKKLDIVGGIARENSYNLDAAGTDSLILNGDFEMGRVDGWTSSGSPTIVSGGYSGNYALQITGPGGNTLSDDYISVDPLYDVFQLEGYFKKTVVGATPGKLYFGYIAYNASKTAITTAPCGSYCYFAASAFTLPADGNWHKFSATTTGEGTTYPKFPVGTKYVRVLGLINYGSSVDAVTLADHISVRRINNGPLFVGNNFSASNLLDQHQESKIYTTNVNNLILEPAASGNVGIGTTTPQNKLDIEGGAVIGATYSGTNVAPTNGLLIEGNVGIGMTSPGYKLDVASGGATTARLGTAAGDAVVIGGGSGKLTVGTVDPLFIIDGKQYATYTPGMTGVKEETAGVLNLRDIGNNQLTAEIDFASAANGSDLWVFRNATDFGEGWKNLGILITPGFIGNVSYKKDAQNNRILIAGSVDGADSDFEVSYRLTAPRFDHLDWSNIPKDAEPGSGLKVR